VKELRNKKQKIRNKEVGPKYFRNPQPFVRVEDFQPLQPPKPPKLPKPPKHIPTFPFAVSAIIVNSPNAIFKKKIIQPTVNRFIQINFISSID
jgi:hypothetical protein